MKEGLYTYRGCWTLDGKPAEGENGKWHSIGLVATNGVTSLAASQTRAWRFVDAVWSTPVPEGTWRYYDGVLLMFGLLHLSGNFKIYLPGDHDKAAAAATPAEAAAPEKAADETEAETPAVEKDEGDSAETRETEAETKAAEKAEK